MLILNSWYWNIRKMASPAISVDIFICKEKVQFFREDTDLIFIFVTQVWIWWITVALESGSSVVSLIDLFHPAGIQQYQLYKAYSVCFPRQCNMITYPAWGFCNNFLVSKFLVWKTETNECCLLKSSAFLHLKIKLLLKKHSMISLKMSL